MKVFLSGRPGIGKTTVFLRVINELRSKGFTIGGFMCPEVRRGRTRVGFSIIDINKNVRGRLAWICSEYPSTLRIGKYCIVVNDVINIAIPALDWALRNADIIAIDEVGPMELKVPQLRHKIEKVLSTNKHILAVIHRSIANSYTLRYGAKLYWVTEANRDKLHFEIINLFRNVKV